MTEFKFFHPIEVRYVDIDSFQHVNNARYFTYMEQGRAAYFASLGLWDGKDFSQLRIILAQINCSYRRPIRFGDEVRVGVATVRLGKKSFDIDYLIRLESGELCAQGTSTLVAYDYEQGQSVALPPDWRQRLAEFEGLD